MKTPIIEITNIYTGSTFQVDQFKKYTHTRTLKGFEDSFSLTLADTRGSLIWDVVACEYTVRAVIGGVENRFRIIDIDYSDSVITCVGQSIETEKFLDEAEPKKISKTTDNAIIEEMLSGYDLVLDEAKKVTEYNIPPGVSKAEVALDVAIENGFLLYASGGKIYKTKIKESGEAEKEYIQQEILNFSLRQSTGQARSELIAYSTTGSHENIHSKTTVEPFSILQNQKLSINRVMRYNVNAKDQEELNRKLEENKEKAQPYESLEFTVKGRDVVDINTIVNISYPKAKINGKFVVNEVKYDVKDNGESTTTISVSGLGRNITSMR